MNLADFHLELNRIVDGLERSNGHRRYSDFVIRGRNLAKEAMAIHLQQWFELNPESLDQVPN